MSTVLFHRDASDADNGGIEPSVFPNERQPGQAQYEQEAIVRKPCSDRERRDRDHRDFVVRVRGRLEQRVAQPAKHERRCHCDHPVTATHVGTSDDQAEREKEQSKEKPLVIGKYLETRKAEQLGKRSTEQEDVRGKMMCVIAEVVHA